MKSALKTLLLMLLTLSATGNSQLIRSYGIKAGPAVAGQDWKYSRALPFMTGSIADKTRWGIDAGPFVEILNIPVVSVLVEGHYVQKGFSEESIVRTSESPEGIGTKSVSPRIDFLSLPLLLKARLDIGPVSPYVVIGPRFDVLLNTEPEGFDVVLDKLKSTDLGLTVGGGVEWAVTGSIRIGVEGRYSPGYQDIYRTSLLRIRNHSAEFLVTASIY